MTTEQYWQRLDQPEDKSMNSTKAQSGTSLAVSPEGRLDTTAAPELEKAPEDGVNEPGGNPGVTILVLKELYYL